MSEVIYTDEVPTGPGEVWVRYPKGVKARKTVIATEKVGSTGFAYNNFIVLFVVFVIILLLLYNRDTLAVRGPAVAIETNNPLPVVSVDPGPAPVTQPIVDFRVYKRVEAARLNLREKPSDYAAVNYVLLQGTRLESLGETHQDLSGGVWIRVRVDTMDGKLTGWVDQRYVS
ncbi:MAG TPA: SH3 domain-containing protein [Blastocatellia bacterium]|nr:SH3 domain-containing protein [Blastocatellia bacterium]